MGIQRRRAVGGQGAAVPCKAHALTTFPTPLPSTTNNPSPCTPAPEDYFMPTLTVLETLQFASRCQNPRRGLRRQLEEIDRAAAALRRRKSERLLGGSEAAGGSGKELEGALEGAERGEAAGDEAEVCGLAGCRGKVEVCSRPAASAGMHPYL